MSVELFRTVVSVPPFANKISYKSSSMLIGSCFTENMGDKLLWYKLPAVINPFGITYNPLSVKKSIERLITGNIYKEDELCNYGGLFFSFDHHSKFSDVDSGSCIAKINSSLVNASEVLKKASHLFLTFGTSYYYELKSSRQIVSNCHKLPDKEFSRFRLKADEIVREYSYLIPALLEYNPGLQVIFTVSPIRHWKDGAHENQVSKSVLFIAIDELCKLFPNIGYFPAYELMMDELRDYRFYEEDMLHPNKTAINFIWEKFIDCFADKTTLRIMNEVEKIQLSKQHRPFNTQNDVFKTFLNQQLNKIEQLLDQHPELDLSEELNYFKSYQNRRIPDMT